MIFLLELILWNEVISPSTDKLPEIDVEPVTLSEPIISAFPVKGNGLNVPSYKSLSI